MKGPNDLWIHDYGVSDNMCGDIKKFKTFNRFDVPFAIATPNKTWMDAMGYGTVIINGESHERVLYVPGLCANLISLYNK